MQYCLLEKQEGILRNFYFYNFMKINKCKIKLKQQNSFKHVMLQYKFT